MPLDELVPILEQELARTENTANRIPPGLVRQAIKWLRRAQEGN